MERSRPSSASPTVRALERGLDVLEFLQRESPATLDAIHRGIGLPKTTTLRLLATLQARGMVRRGLSDGLYRSGARLQRLTAATDATALLADAAAPVLDRLCREVGWPSDLVVRRGCEMEVVETSRAASPIMINRDLVGERIPMLVTAVGRAYLAFCGAEERAALLREIAVQEANRGRASRSATINKMLAAVRAKGYGERDPLISGWFAAQDRLDDDLLAIGVPIGDSNRLLGCLNLVWMRPMATVEAMAEAHLDRLRQAAREIAGRVGPERPPPE